MLAITSTSLIEMTTWKKHIESSLLDRTDADKYLKSLYDLYSRTVKLSNDLLHFDMGSDNNFLSKLTRNIFQKYLDSYIR
uniref:Exocyst complex component Sec10-like alpha-helical bundle domain-containing protein n=1 Tax=Timema monikensis TaxID=170555 RepID=A0A7R9HWR7_9NEOP|nr:unnamed protein product [Timema monikensis]